jgi:lipopolysaccharide biosynthesis glycosyltransferase
MSWRIPGMSESVLVTLADRNYVRQAKQLFSSVYRNSGWEGDHLLLSQGVENKDLEWFRARGIEVFECEPLADRNIGKWPPIVLSKFYMFTEGFKRWARVVYLDGDITVEASLGKLASPDGFSAVADVHRIPLRDQFIEHPKNGDALRSLEEEYDTSVLSFKCGVFSFSTKMIRNDTFQVLGDLFDRYRDILRFPEQAVMNLYFYGKWDELPIVYNNYHTRLRYPWRLGTVPCDGICNHFIEEKPWIIKDDYFYLKWKGNLDLADGIEPGSRKAPSSVWSEDEVAARSRMIDDLTVNRSMMTRIGQGCVFGAERIAGTGGRILKRISPVLYKRLKG